MSEREQMNVGLNLAVHPSATSFDIYQSPGRCFIGQEGLLSTVCTGSRIYVPSLKRLLLGRELLMTHGLPGNILCPNKLKTADMSDALLRDLAGNSFVGHVFFAVLLSVLTHFPHAAQSTEETAEKNDSVIETVSSLLDM